MFLQQLWFDFVAKQFGLVEGGELVTMRATEKVKGAFQHPTCRPINQPTTRDVEGLIVLSRIGQVSVYNEVRGAAYDVGADAVLVGGKCLHSQLHTVETCRFPHEVDDKVVGDPRWHSLTFGGVHLLIEREWVWREHRGLMSP